MSGPRTSKVSRDSSRTIVLCFDGTRGQYDSTNTNVVKFFGLLRKDCPDKQIAYYQAGIGTYFAPGVVSPLWSGMASLLDEAFAWYLGEHVMAGYRYLMDNYCTGDKICLFGFSRGAFTARALAGMITKVGLLSKDNWQQVNFAYKAYKRTDTEGIKLAAGFKQTFSQDVKIEFVGVWDTVQSTGVLVNRILPFTDDNTAIRVFRHALSLDEHRARFRPNLYHWPTQVNVPGDVANSMETAAPGRFHSLKSSLKWLFKSKSQRVQAQQSEDSSPFADDARDDNVTRDGLQPKAKFFSEEWPKCIDVKEVWFAGCHSDIGGGNVQDDVKVSLAQIPLHWMVEQVIQSQCGILFISDELARIGFSPPSPSALTSSSVVQEWPHESNQLISSSEAFPESSDAIAPLFDQLKIDKVWWLLEFFPTSYAWQDGKGAWHSVWRINLGRARFIPFQKPLFHHTVKERMDYKPLQYKPLAIHDQNVVYI